MVVHLHNNHRCFLFIMIFVATSVFTYSFLAVFKQPHVHNHYERFISPTRERSNAFRKNLNITDNFRDIYSNFSVSVSALQNQLVVYNRVTKCGSSTMIWISKELAKLRRFRFIAESRFGLIMNFSDSQKVSFAKRLSSLGPNTLFIRHFHFFNFAEYSQPSPVFINVIREPVDRFISRFYYRRYGFQDPRNKNYLTKKQKLLPPGRLNMTIEECVFGGVEDCLVAENYKSLMTFFCEDSSPKCRELTDYSLGKAMKNVAKYYTSIGLLEDLDNTLKVFQAVLPRYFTGASKLLPLCPETTRTKSRHRTEPSDDLKSILRKALRVDIEFYEFVKKRFYRQLHELRKLGRIAANG